MTSSTDEQSIRNWNIIPSIVNAGSTISIESEESMIGADIAVRDMSGRLILSDQLQSSTVDIPSNWSAGIYLVQINTQGAIHTQKIVVR